METKTADKTSFMWNLWHGCHKLSAGCRHCYVYRGDARHGLDSTVVVQTKSFDLPVRKKRNGAYKIPSGATLYTCFTSDFLVEDADPWRAEAWRMMRIRSDLDFFMITKRIDRLHAVLPGDWGDGYDNVTIACTVENQDRADYRLPIYMSAPVKDKLIICEPLLEQVDLRPYMGGWVEQVIVGGESGDEARACHFDWVLDIRTQCIEKQVPFFFKQTGANFVKDGRQYHIKRQFPHAQARKAGLDFSG
jgi:protein gp37